MINNNNIRKVFFTRIKLIFLVNIRYFIILSSPLCMFNKIKIIQITKTDWKNFKQSTYNNWIPFSVLHNIWFQYIIFSWWECVSTNNNNYLFSSKYLVGGSFKLFTSSILKNFMYSNSPSSNISCNLAADINKQNKKGWTFDFYVYIKLFPNELSIITYIGSRIPKYEKCIYISFYYVF